MRSHKQAALRSHKHKFRRNSGMVDRYVKACLKEDSAAYCRCEFQSVTQVVHDPKDVAFLVQLEEETAGKPDAETDAILKKLPRTGCNG